MYVFDSLSGMVFLLFYDIICSTNLDAHTPWYRDSQRRAKNRGVDFYLSEALGEDLQASLHLNRAHGGT
jgi:hypothetical protein